jgi:hypothetical protein
MTLDKLQSRQATEHQKLSDEIVENVADRKWTKDTLAKNLDALYMMGIRHGWEAASLAPRAILDAVADSEELEIISR